MHISNKLIARVMVELLEHQVPPAVFASEFSDGPSMAPLPTSSTKAIDVS